MSSEQVSTPLKASFAFVLRCWSATQARWPIPGSVEGGEISAVLKPFYALLMDVGDSRQSADRIHRLRSPLGELADPYLVLFRDDRQLTDLVRSSVLTIEVHAL